MTLDARSYAMSITIRISVSLRGAAAALVAAFTFVPAIGLQAAPADSATNYPPPFVAAEGRLAQAGRTNQVELGELLIGELNCLSCHAASDDLCQRIPTRIAPDLNNVGARLAPSYIRAYLAKPHDLKPGAAMPDIFHASENASSEPVIEFLTHYLSSLGGVLRLRQEPIDGSLVGVGEKLYHSVGCVACHSPGGRDKPEAGDVPLGALARKTSVDQLADFLIDPLRIRPSGRMPSLGLTPGEARAIAVYLLREQIDNPRLLKPNSPTMRGVAFEYFKGRQDATADFSGLKPDAEGRIARPGDAFPDIVESKEAFAARLTTQLSVYEAGPRSFRLTAGVESRISVDGQMLAAVRSGGSAVSAIELDAGSHRLEILQIGKAGDGGPTLEWSRTLSDWEAVPAERLSVPNEVTVMPIGWLGVTLDPAKVRLGRQMFSALRCVSCHAVEDVTSTMKAKPLEKLKVYSLVGCIGEHVRKGVPNYRISDTQRAAIKAALRRRAELARPLGREETIERSLATLNCRACHERDGIGGPAVERAAHFHATAAADLGPEGSLPPSLTGVGGKLRERALERILYDGELRARPYMATRMPRFGKENLGGLVEALAAEDKRPGDDEPPAFTEASAEDGHRLAGAAGMSCVACHGVRGAPALATQGIDLALMRERIRQEWFREFLKNPGALKPGTRMPVFWPDGVSPLKDIAGGDTARQIDALWNFLSQGAKMPLPEGMTQDARQK